jgi:hypothetical protein
MYRFRPRNYAQSHWVQDNNQQQQRQRGHTYVQYLIQSVFTSSVGGLTKE